MLLLNKGNLLEMDLTVAIMDLLKKGIANNIEFKTSNFGYELMENYGRYKFMLDNKELFDKNNIEKILSIYGGGSVLESVKEIEDYYTFNSVKNKSDSKGYASHFLMQALVEILINKHIKMYFRHEMNILDLEKVLETIIDFDY
jgi:UDP-glucose 4-epimerase